MIGYGGENNPDEEEFADLYANMIVLLLDNKVPAELFDLLRDNELCGPPKGEGDCRPICMGECFRKIASICFLVATNFPLNEEQGNDPNADTFNKVHFKNIQYGMEQNGCEKIIHQVRASIESYPERDHFFADAKMAYQNVPRMLGLVEVRKHFPIILPFLRNIYGHDSHGWVFTENQIVPINSLEGFHQGDCVSSWLYCMTILPFCKGLYEILGDQGFVKFFYDDGNISGNFDRMLEAMEYIRTEGPKYGYFLQNKKGAYLLGKCPDRETALERKQLIATRFDLDANSIFIHPDNGGDALIYGAKVLGSYVGSDDFIVESLRQKLSKLEKQADNIINKVDAKQIQFLLLRWCFSQKVNYLQRTIPPWFLNPGFNNAFDRLKKKILLKILNIGELDNKLWSLACETIAKGGLGLQHTEIVSSAAFTASLMECSKHVEDFLHIDSLTTARIGMVEQLKNAINYINVLADKQEAEDKLTFESLKVIANEKRSQTLQHYISQFCAEEFSNQLKSLFDTPEETAWLTSLQDPDAGIWLEMAPKTSAHMMTNIQFEMALCLRLRLPQRCIVKNIRCSCSTARKMVTPDVYGLHFCSGCNKDGVRIQTHDRIRDQFERILRYCDILTVREERNVFRGVDPDNGKRPDISALNLPGKTIKQLLDIRLTSPVPATNPENLLMPQAVIPLRAAKKAYDEKMRKFNEDANNSNLGFIPIVFEITGKMHPVTRDLLHQVIQQKARLKVAPFAAMWKYWVSSLMVTLQKKLVEGILERCSNIYGGKFDVTHESTRQTIIEIGRMRL